MILQGRVKVPTGGKARELSWKKDTVKIMAERPCDQDEAILICIFKDQQSA